jgi:hypothetical protein
MIDIYVDLAGSSISVSIIIKSNWVSNVYEFSIEQWTTAHRRLSPFLIKFHRHHLRNEANYGSIQDNENGIKYTMTDNQKVWRKQFNSI